MAPNLATELAVTRLCNVFCSKTFWPFGTAHHDGLQPTWPQSTKPTVMAKVCNPNPIGGPVLHSSQPNARRSPPQAAARGPSAATCSPLWCGKYALVWAAIATPAAKHRTAARPPRHSTNTCPAPVRRPAHHRPRPRRRRRRCTVARRPTLCPRVPPPRLRGSSVFSSHQCERLCCVPIVS